MMRNDYCRTMHELSAGSDPTAAGGGVREGSEWQRSARREPASTGEATAGYRNRMTRR